MLIRITYLLQGLTIVESVARVTHNNHTSSRSGIYVVLHGTPPPWSPVATMTAPAAAGSTGVEWPNRKRMPEKPCFPGRSSYCKV